MNLYNSVYFEHLKIMLIVSSVSVSSVFLLCSPVPGELSAEILNQFINYGSGDLAQKPVN